MEGENLFLWCTWMVKVEASLEGLGALGLVEVPVERVLGQRDDLTLGPVVLLRHSLHYLLANRGLKFEISNNFVSRKGF